MNELSDRAPARGTGVSGRVYLVGAGPGNPALLTARALTLIAGADVILYDRLIPSQALAGARPDAELVFVGKQGGDGESVPQQRTEALMVARASEGKTVVRLKGGDPFVFGRGGEEALALREAGIVYEIVPGVTAGVAAPAYAGIPVTHRGLASAVAFVTGHEDPAKRDQQSLDWAALAAFPGTLVFYMGVRRLAEICQSLLDAGRAASEPAAVIQSGTLPEQRSVSGTLATIAQRALQAEIQAPAVAVVGPVAVLSQQLAWHAPGVLSGRTVAVTRARAQASSLASALEALGARVVQAPAIRIRPLPGPALDPAPYDLVCVTSASGAHALFDRLAVGGRDARALAGARVAAVGRATATALAEHGIRADIVPERAVSEELAEALRDVPVRRALIARARRARDVLPDALRERGADVDVLDLYETVAEPLAPEVLERARASDYITFTSASTVEFFLRAADGAVLSQHTRVVSIGPVTSEALRAHGLRVDIEAQRHDVQGLIDAVLADASR
jgi:uroporphyrinogen III methyltransferase / synthase